MLLEQSQDSPVQRHKLPAGAMDQSARLVGGVQSLVDALANTLPAGTIELNTTVTAIQMDEEDNIILETELANEEKKKVRASAVILALPPRIVAQHIAFTPALSAELASTLMDKPTWMAGQTKIVAIYDRPFWREDGLSGQAMSWAGPLQEIHDASPFDTGCGALFGFFGLPANIRQQLGKETVVNLAVEQLVRLFGNAAENPISILYKDWSLDSETAHQEDTKLLHAFPNYGPITNSGAWKNKISFAGTETSQASGGHLEGALQSGERAVQEILQERETN